MLHAASLESYGVFIPLRKWHGTMNAIIWLLNAGFTSPQPQNEMFGAAEESPQNERTGFRPRSSNGISKVAGYELTRNYLEVYGRHASSGLLFDHEPPRQGYEHSKDHVGGCQDSCRRTVEASFRIRSSDGMMLQRDQPDDYLIVTGTAHSVENFVAVAFPPVNLDRRDHVVADPTRFRPAEVQVPAGGYANAEVELDGRRKLLFLRISEGDDRLGVRYHNHTK